MNNMNVVITGATKGIGYSLAEAFLKKGCSVTICGRSTEAIDKAVKSLAAVSKDELIQGVLCDVVDYEQVIQLWNSAVSRFKRIDIWINNAGCGQGQTKVWELESKDYTRIINSNIIGLLNCCKVAVSRMLVQDNGGYIYNMEGYGSDGTHRTSGLGIYGASKSAVRFINEELFSEVRNTVVKVGSLQPGMVLTAYALMKSTDLLVGGMSEMTAQQQESFKKILNILAEKPDVVGTYLVDKILNNNGNGARISFVGKTTIAWRFLSYPFSNRNITDGVVFPSPKE